MTERFREEFSYFGDRIYMNWSSMGMQPLCARRAAEEFFPKFGDSLGADPSCYGSTIGPHVKEMLGRMIHAEPEDIFFIPNTTTGNNLLARGLKLEAGDEVLVGSNDFPSVYMPWTNRQAEGVVLRVLRPQDGFVSAEQFINAMTDRTRVVAVSLVQSRDGYRIDMEKLGKACRERGILLSVDGIQGLGRLCVDVEKMNIDVLSSSSYKGLLGTFGAGFCWCRAEVMNTLTPMILSGNVDWANYGFPFSDGSSELAVPPYAKRAARMETGTLSNIGLAVMEKSLGLLLDTGIENIEKHVLSVEDRLRERLEALPEGWSVVTPERSCRSGIVAVNYPKEKDEAIHKALEDAKIHVTQRGYLRISLHAVNTAEEADRLADVLLSVK